MNETRHQETPAGGGFSVGQQVLPTLLPVDSHTKGVLPIASKEALTVINLRMDRSKKLLLTFQGKRGEFDASFFK